MDAAIIGFLPGPLAGKAIADFLTGRASPSARLPLTYPKHQDLSGSPYLHEVSDMCTRDTGDTLPHWDNVPCEIQWPFGHGLSYTRFTYGNLNLSTTILQQHWRDDEDYKRSYDDEHLTATVTITNTGDMAGAETILFFSFDEFRSTTPEYKRLRGYEKVWLEPGESKDVSITVSLEDDLRFVGPHDNSHYILQDGLEFRIGVGSDSDCRGNPDAEESLCSDIVTIRTEEDYIGACEAACRIWKEIGGHCAQNIFLPKVPNTANAIGNCRKLCINAEFFYEKDVKLNSDDGWGWNYVKCLETIVWNERFDSKTDCWKLTSFCRDITRTMGMDQYGNAYNRSGSFSGIKPNADAPQSAIIVAMLAGAFASAMIVRAICVGFSTTANAHPQRTNQGKKYGDVEFSAIRNSEVRNHDVCLTL